MTKIHKSIIFFFALLSVNVVVGQSKKELNASYRQQLQRLYFINDSIQRETEKCNNIFSQKQSLVYYKREKLVEFPLSELKCIQSFETARKLLEAEGGNADFVLKDPEFLELNAPTTSFDISTYENLVNTRISPAKFVLDSSVVYAKVKVQNRLLCQEIARCDSLNRIGLKQLDDWKNTSKIVAEMENTLTSYNFAYSTYLLTYNSYVGKLYQERSILIEKKEREAELAEEKRLAKLAKKNPKTKKFVPPVIVNDEVAPELTMELPNESVEHSGWEIVPEPTTFESINKPEVPEIYEVVDESATFPEGSTALKEFINKNLVYPQRALELGISGRCYVRFVISENGNVSNARVIRGVTDCPECDQIAIDIVRKMPNWIPARIGGKTVNSWYTLPIKFETIGK